MMMTPAKVTEEICWIRIKTLVDIVSKSSGRIIPKGTYGTVVEHYSDLNMYAVNLRSNCYYFHEILTKNQFEVL